MNAVVLTVVCSDNYWLGTTTPCVTYGLRGLAYFKVSVSGPGADLHSGVYGGMVHEPMTDLFQLFSKLVTPSGDILVPGIYDHVAPLTDEERKRYEVIDVQLSDFEDAVGGKVTISQDKVKVLMGRMRFPSLSLHGIEGAFSAAGAKVSLFQTFRVSAADGGVPRPDRHPCRCSWYVVRALLSGDSSDRGAVTLCQQASSRSAWCPT